MRPASIPAVLRVSFPDSRGGHLESSMHVDLFYSLYPGSDDEIQQCWIDIERNEHAFTLLNWLADEDAAFRIQVGPLSEALPVSLSNLNISRGRWFLDEYELNELISTAAVPA